MKLCGSGLRACRFKDTVLAVLGFSFIWFRPYTSEGFKCSYSNAQVVFVHGNRVITDKLFMALVQHIPGGPVT